MAADPNYPDTGENESTAEDSNPADNENRENSDEPSKETTLIPASFFGDKEKEVGDECKIRVVSVHDGEIECEYVKHDDSEDNSDEGDKSPTEAMTGAPPPKMMSRGGY